MIRENKKTGGVEASNQFSCVILRYLPTELHGTPLLTKRIVRQDNVDFTILCLKILLM